MGRTRPTWRFWHRPVSPRPNPANKIALPLLELARVLVRFDHIARVIANADHKQSGLWTLMAAPVPSGKAQQNLTSGARNLCADARCSHADLRFIIELGDSFVASLYSILDDPFVCLVLWPLLGSYAHPPFNPRDGIATLAPRAPARRGAPLRRLRLLLWS